MRDLVLLGLVLLPGLFGQRSPVPYDFGPAFPNKLVGFADPGDYSSVSNVDFRNFKFHVFYFLKPALSRTGIGSTMAPPTTRGWTWSQRTTCVAQTRTRESPFWFCCRG